MCSRFYSKTMGSLILISSLFVCFTSSCNSKKFYDETYADTNKMTLGTVQKEIRPGMTQDQVVIALGSPNIVTRDREQKETWVYDKIATQVRSSGTGGLMLFFQTGADYVKRHETSQQTLTVVIKFNTNNEVETMTYHSSKF